MDALHILLYAPEADGIHPQGPGDVFADLILPQHPAPGPLHQVAQEDEHVVIVLIFAAEAAVHLQKGQLAHEVFPVAGDLFPEEIVAGESGAVTGQIPDGKMGSHIGIQHLELRDDVPDGPVPGEETVVNGLGRQHDGPRFGSGGHIEECFLRHGELVFPVGITVVISIDYLAAADDIHHTAHQAGLPGDALQRSVQGPGQSFFVHIRSSVFVRDFL